MKRGYSLALAALMALTATPASADMTMKMSMSMTGPMQMQMASTMYIKGLKMRTDANVNGQEVSLLVDVATKQQLMIQHSTKTVQELNPGAAAAAMPMSIGEPSVSVTPTGGKKEVLGRLCQEYTIRVSMPMTMGEETVTMVMAGPAWIAKDAPGVADFQAFYKAAAAAGITASPFGPGPQNKGMPEMQKALAESGIPLEQDMKLTVEGTGQAALMMGQMAMGMTTKVTELTTDPIPDDTFAVPAGYTKK